jgi:hypothetical protein
VVLQRIMIAHCFSLAWAIVLGVSAAATASPRGPSEMGGPFITGSASAQSQNFAGSRYGTARGNTAASAPDPLTAALTRRRNRSKTLHRSGEHSVAQISPTILRGKDPYMEDELGQPCAAKARRHFGCYRAKSIRPKGLVDALLEAPSPATEQVLKNLGIPAIKDVPPIAILRPGHPGADENTATDLR